MNLWKGCVAKLPTNLVVITSNVTYHCWQVTRWFRQYSLRSVDSISVALLCAIRRWGNVIYTKNYKNWGHKIKIYIDFFQVHCHKILRTSPYICDLSAIELAIVKLQYLLRLCNTEGYFSLKVLHHLNSEGLTSITVEEWSRYYRLLQKVNVGKRKYMRRCGWKYIFKCCVLWWDDTNLSSDGCKETDSDCD